MASYRIKLKKSTQKEIQRLPKAIRVKVIALITSLSSNPLPIDTKKIKGSKRSYRLRQGDYRIVYDIDLDESVITIVRVQHRKDVYR